MVKHIATKGASGSNPSEEVTQRRGREEHVDPDTPRWERFKDMISAFGLRLSQVEEGVSGMEAHVDDLSQRVDDLEAEDAVIHTAIKGMLAQLEESLRGEMAKIREEFMGELIKMRQVHEKELNGTLARIEEMHEDLVLCKRALATGAGTSGIVEAKRIEVPKPKSFGGSRNACEVDNFLLGLDQYFGAVGITEDDAKIRTVTLYLTDTDMLWWRRRRGDVKKGECTIITFDDFTKELKRQFYPENAEDEARARLRRLKHSGSIHDYIKDFANLVLEIPDLPDKDALFNFMDGLQPWAKTELRRRGVQDLATAIAVAESLIDYTSPKESTGKPKEKNSSYAKGGGDKGQRKDEPRQDNYSARSKDKGKQKETRSSGKPNNNKCFLYDGPHWARDYPQKRALSALLGSHQNETEVEGDNGGAHVGSM